MQTNHVKKWQKNNIRSVNPEHNKWHKVTIKQSHKQFAYMNLKKGATQNCYKERANRAPFLCNMYSQRQGLHIYQINKKPSRQSEVFGSFYSSPSTVC
jgi:hypothetical protein